MATIEIRHLEKSFPKFRLGPLSLMVESGEILGIMGPNGAGKTTLLRLVWGFLRPDSGSISVFGYAPHLHQVRIRLNAGYVSESPHFYGSLKAFRFLEFVSTFYDHWSWERVHTLLDQFRIDPESPIEKLSKGNRMKLGLISAVGHRPSLLILDELTSGLDPLCRMEILTFIRKLSREAGVSVVLSSHISDDLDRIADSVLILNDGGIVEYSQLPKVTSKYGLSQLEDIFLRAIGAEHNPERLD